MALKVPVLALITLAPDMLPPEPEPVTSTPDMFAVPATFIPVPLTTTMLALPIALIVMLPLAVAILTLLFPLLMLEPPPPPLIPVNWLPLPMKNAPLTLPVVLILPLPVFNVPDTFTPVPVTVNVVLPALAIVTLPFAVAI